MYFGDAVKSQISGEGPLGRLESGNHQSQQDALNLEM